MKLEKIYDVEFMYYTGYSHDTVSSNPGEAKKDTKYLDTSASPFLVRESDLNIFQKYGGGFRNLRYVGTLHIPDEKDIVPDAESLTVINDCTTNNCIDNCVDNTIHNVKDNCIATDPAQISLKDLLKYDGPTLPMNYTVTTETSSNL